MVREGQLRTGSVSDWGAELAAAHGSEHRQANSINVPPENPFIALTAAEGDHSGGA